MKKYLPSVATACIGLCAGFALCYLCLVIPHREDKARRPASQQQIATITITHDGSVYLAGERLAIEQLAPRLKKLGGKPPVIIRADNTSDYRCLLEVMDACKAAGVKPISIASVPAP